MLRWEQGSACCSWQRDQVVTISVSGAKSSVPFSSQVNYGVLRPCAPAVLYYRLLLQLPWYACARVTCVKPKHG